MAPNLWTVKFDNSGRQLRELEGGGEQPQAQIRKNKGDGGGGTKCNIVQSSWLQPFDEGTEGQARLTGNMEETNLKEAKTEGDATVECLAGIVAEAV